jgi:chloramphenicol-sensitive protein RarD
MNNRNYYLAAISSFFIWGVFSLPLRMMSSYGAGQILFFRVFFAVLILISSFLIAGRKSARENFQIFKSLDPKQKLIISLLTVGGGILLVANWLIFIYVVNSVNIRTATFSYFICPVLTAVFAFALLKEKLGTLQWIAVLLCALSCALIGKDSVTELGYSLVIASTYAFYLITQRKNNAFDRLFILMIQLSFAMLIILPFYPMLVSSVPSDAGFYFAVAGISLVFTIVPLFLNLYALKGMSSSTLGILMYINPIINFTIGVMYFNEKITANQSIGFTIIAFALLLFNYQAMRRMRNRRIDRKHKAGDAA